ncbi:rolling circle replication-associated protein [Spiroplasma endosymbiont of Colias croceus]|uniref:rolling circle replication-associated protein n=1 Tax=Spiroplasma endosymbiont of Colias croceus TaxID=3066310 RepID=UPI0030CF8073
MLHAESYYVKSVFYGNYVKEIFLPLSMINFNKRNICGIKNTGKNEKKLTHNNIRAKSNFIRKIYHNFADCKKLSFLTLTYQINENNVKKCKKDLAKFFRNIKSWLLTNKNKSLKYVYTYEYQDRGAVHFHILMNTQIPNKIILKN